MTNLSPKSTQRNTGIKNYKIFLIISGSLIVIIGTCVVIYFALKTYNSKPYDENYANYIRSGKKMYCYDLYHGPVNPALCVNEPKYINLLKNYYIKVEKGNMTPDLGFYPYEVPTDTCVYVLSYIGQDSSIAKVGFFYKFKNKSGITVCYVYKNTLHSIQRKWEPPYKIK